MSPRWTSAENKAHRMDTDTSVAEQVALDHLRASLAAERRERLAHLLDELPAVESAWDIERQKRERGFG